MDISVLKTYKKYEENNETLITIYFYNIKKEEAINLVQKELNKISLIQNLSKKKKLNSRFYNLKYNDDFVIITNEKWVVPEKYGNIVPLCAGKELGWKCC